MPRRTKTRPAPSPPQWSSKIVATVLSTTTFGALGIDASIWVGGRWQAIHLTPGVGEFESEHGKELLRWAYNDRCLAEVQRGRKLVCGEHAGFHDLFVPIEQEGPVKSILVAGPFATDVPTAHNVMARWYELTHARARLADPGFSRYLSSTLASLTLRGPLRTKFERWMAILARQLDGPVNPQRWARQADKLARELVATRAVERMWEAARSMVDDRTAHLWSTPLKRDPLRDLGMDRPAEHVIVGLLRPRQADREPVDEALRCRGYQRAMAELSWRTANLVAGQLGDRGVSLLMTVRGSSARVRSALLDWTGRAADIARHFGFRLHAGIAVASAARASLAMRYREAIAAAEGALSREEAVVFAHGQTDVTSGALADLRARLARSLEGRPNVLLARFERYASSVVAQTGYELGAARAHLEAGLDRLAEPLLASGQLDPRSLDELRASIARRGADNVAALVHAYRDVVGDIEQGLRTPTAARQDRSTRRALDFIREHLAEPLTLPQVARVAGFAPGYFSRLLQRDVGATFDRYLQQLRLKSAKQALAGTSLSVERVAHLAGFRSRTYFQRLFRAETGATPAAYRRRQSPK